MKVKVEQAIKMVRDNKSLKGLVIEDLTDTQIRAVDALALAECGILIPEQNIYYSDEDIAYDPDFDDVQWSDEPIKMTWEEKMQLAEKIEKNKEKELTIKIRISDHEVRQWINENDDKMGKILGNLIENIYKANKIMQE